MPWEGYLTVFPLCWEPIHSNINTTPTITWHGFVNILLVFWTILTPEKIVEVIKES